MTAKQDNNRKESSNRIQTSLLNAMEKKALVWMAEHLPSWVSSDQMTFLGVIGAFLTGAGFALTNFGAVWFWLASFGLFVNWVGDSLDGTIARVRHQPRPLYGFYIDHNLDAVCQLFIFAGAGLSPYLNLSFALLALVVYLMMEIYVMICAHLKNEFKLTYGKLGPTEFRAIIIFINTVFYFSDTIREWHVGFNIVGEEVVIYSFDIVCLFIFALLLVLYLDSMLRDARYFAKIDPLPKKKEE